MLGQGSSGLLLNKEGWCRWCLSSLAALADCGLRQRSSDGGHDELRGRDVAMGLVQEACTSAPAQDGPGNDKDDDESGAGEEHDEKKARLVRGLLLDMAKLLFDEVGGFLLEAVGKPVCVMLLFFHTGLDAGLSADVGQFEGDAARANVKWPKLQNRRKFNGPKWSCHWNRGRISRIIGVDTKGVEE